MFRWFEDSLVIGALVLAPADPNALIPVVEEVMADGVPVMFIDTRGANDGVPYIGTEIGSAGTTVASAFVTTSPKARI